MLPAGFRTEWRWLLWPTLAGLELAHLNAAKLGMGSTSTESAPSLSQGPAHSTLTEQLLRQRQWARMHARVTS